MDTTHFLIPVMSEYVSEHSKSYELNILSLVDTYGGVLSEMTIGRIGYLLSLTNLIFTLCCRSLGIVSTVLGNVTSVIHVTVRMLLRQLSPTWELSSTLQSVRKKDAI